MKPHRYLANSLSNDYEILALKAGSGLIAMKTPKAKATEKLETILEALLKNLIV